MYNISDSAESSIGPAGQVRSEDHATALENALIYEKATYLTKGNIMHGLEKHGEFIELRGKGMSYAKIAKELGVGRQTLVRWADRYQHELHNAHLLGLEAVQEKYRLTLHHHIERLGKQMELATEELERRDLINIPTARLFEIISRIGNDSTKVKLAKEFLYE